MAVPPIPSLSPSQLATLATLGEERTAAAGDVLYRVEMPLSVHRHPRGRGAILDAAGNEIVRHGAPASSAS
jgi:hypothetical protein